MIVHPNNNISGIFDVTLSLIQRTMKEWTILQINVALQPSCNKSTKSLTNPLIADY